MPLDLKVPQDNADPKKESKFICKAHRRCIFNDDHDFAVLLIKWTVFVDNEQNISLLCNIVLIRNLLQPYLPNKRAIRELENLCLNFASFLWASYWNKHEIGGL